MSAPEVPVKADVLNEISDAVAAMVAGILQEQLAPIREAIREHSRLLDLHSALLNHSTVMNRYNVGKLDDLRDLQTSVNYKLQFHIDPEDRQRPTLRGQQPTTTVTSTPQSTTIAASTSPQTNDSPPSEHSPSGNTSGISSESQDHTDIQSAASSVTSAPDSPTRQPTPPFDPPAPPPTPPQATADGRGARTTKRGLRRERAYNETPDPMWNSSRKINLSEPLPAPPPPSISPPVCADKVVARRSETSKAVASQASTTTPKLSDERAVGKKRKREDDASSCAVDTSDSRSVSDEPGRKRKKDTTISTERLPIPEGFLRLARLNIFGDPSFEERRCEVEQMRYMKNLFRGT